MDTIGERLEAERKRLGLNQEEMAQIGGVGRNTQYKYERDKGVPDADYLSKIFEHGADPVFIITGRRLDELGSKVRIYNRRSDATDAVLSVQQDLGLTLTAEQMKILLDFAYEHQVDAEGIKKFVTSAATLQGYGADSE